MYVTTSKSTRSLIAFQEFVQAKIEENISGPLYGDLTWLYVRFQYSAW